MTRSETGHASAGIFARRRKTFGAMVSSYRTRRSVKDVHDQALVGFSRQCPFISAVAAAAGPALRPARSSEVTTSTGPTSPLRPSLRTARVFFRRHAHEIDLSRRMSNEANDNILSGLGAVPYFCCAAGATEGQFQGDSMTPNPPLDGIDQKILYRDATSKDTEAIAD
jgi:hypothetical protein